MNNQNIPANPVIRLETRKINDFADQVCDVSYSGETKREKAFWQVYSSMLGHPETECSSYDNTANSALEAVNAGFKALESND
jgi:hypothetical protein